MDALDIVFFALAILGIIMGLVLSGQGAGSGIAALSGQDTELFRKTKDRGFVKQMQRIMFILSIVFIVIGILLVTDRDPGLIVGVAVAIFVVLTTASVLGHTNDRRAHVVKSAIGIVAGAGIGFVAYMLAIDSNRKGAVNVHD